MNSDVEESTNGMASFFSFAYSPGAMKNHTCNMMYGEAIRTPVSAAILICSMNPSLGSVKISLPSGMSAVRRA